jgi:hypothetical protein
MKPVPLVDTAMVTSWEQAVMPERIPLLLELSGQAPATAVTQLVMPLWVK